MTPLFFEGPHGRLAYQLIEGAAPGVVWLGGFRSDMTGSKATRLAAWAEREGRAFLRFDYSGHGASDGAFEDGAIGDWTRDAEAAIGALTRGPQILVGSSMGGWVAALLAREATVSIYALVLVAPALDFTEELMLPSMSPEDRATLAREGRLVQASPYDDAPTVITHRLIEDGRQHLTLTGGVAYTGPVRIIQGMADPDVPWRHAARTAAAFAGEDIEILMIKSGDHRLSTEPDLQRLERMVASL